MSIKDNPFYILKVSCVDDRRAIISAAEEMSFMLDAEVCTEAQNILINPAKRLSAELSWFIDVDEEKLQTIRTCIDGGASISIDALLELSPISELNATVYNFSVSNELDSFELGYEILDIDEQYAELDIQDILNSVNRNRTKAKMVTVSEQDISSGWSKRREQIRQAITEKLAQLDDAAYIELVTMLADKCIADEGFNDGVVLSDVVDQYEIRMQSEIERRATLIEALISEAKETTSDIDDKVDALIREVKAWDKIVQPLQLKSKATGMPHKNSEKLGYKLRQLVLDLHNNKHETEAAYALAKAMCEVFSEVEKLGDLFASDAKTLSSMALPNNAKVKEILASLKMLEKEAAYLLDHITGQNVSNFISKIQFTNVCILASGLDEGVIVKLRERLCYLARNTAITMHNEKKQLFSASSLAKALIREFGDVPSLQAKLQADAAALGIKASSQPTESKKQGGFKPGLLLFIAFVVVCLIIRASIESPNANNSSAPKGNSSSYSQGSSTSSKKSELKDKIDTLKSRIGIQEHELELLSGIIDDTEEKLEDLESDLDRYEQLYYSTGNDSYRISFNACVEEYNDLYDDYLDRIDTYNDLYDSYDENIEKYNSLVAQYNLLN